MAKRKMSENSLKNLENGKKTQFVKGDLRAKELQLVGAEKKKENNIVINAAIKTLNKVSKKTNNKSLLNFSMNEIAEMLASGELSPKDFRELLLFLIEMSGQKPANKVEQDLSVSASLTTIDFGGEE